MSFDSAKMSDADELLLGDTEKQKSGRHIGRWWIVVTYSIVAMTQGAQWAFPGNVQETMQTVYGMDGNTIQLLLNYGPIFWMISCVPYGYYMDRYGAKWSVLSSIWLVFLSALLRLFAQDQSTLSIALVHISFILNALAGPVAMAAVSRLSEDWFPAGERVTATAVMAEANNCAGILMWLLVPTVIGTSSDIDHMMNLNYVFVGISAVNLLMGHAYFPSHPPHAPSASAAVQRDDAARFTWKSYWHAIVKLSKHKGFMVLMISYSAIAGMGNSLSGELIIILSNIGYSQAQSGWVGFAASWIGMAMGVGLAKWTDKKRKGKKLLIGLLVSSAAAWAIFAFVAQGVLPQSFTFGTGGFFLTGIVFTLCNCLFDAAIPLLFELGVEATYPIPEATVIMYMTTVMNVATSIVLFVPQDSVGVGWMPWAMTGITIVFAALVAWIYEEASPRYEFDMSHQLDVDSKAALLDAKQQDDDNAVLVMAPSGAGADGSIQ